MTVRGMYVAALAYSLVTVVGWSHPLPALAQVRAEQINRPK